jgi:hypothetical protein
MSLVIVILGLKYAEHLKLFSGVETVLVQLEMQFLMLQVIF